MAHRSYCAEVGGTESNERLEFLGDAVLGWVVADLVYRRHTELPEGKLTDLRKSVVNARALAEVAASIDLGPRLLLGRGEDHAGGRQQAVDPVRCAGGRARGGVPRRWGGGRRGP